MQNDATAPPGPRSSPCRHTGPNRPCQVDIIENNDVRERILSLEERSRERRRRMVAHVAAGFEDAEAWDLEFWQAMTPEERLSAFVAIRRDVEVVEAARDADRSAEG